MHATRFPAREPRRPGLLVVVAACLLLGVLSLAVRSGLGYDPWAWLVWGRELTRLDLDTLGGPSWKPLPVILIAPFTWLGALAPSIWLVLSRAAAFAAVALSYRLASRFAGRAAGLVAAFGLCLSADFFVTGPARVLRAAADRARVRGDRAAPRRPAARGARARRGRGPAAPGDLAAHRALRPLPARRHGEAADRGRVALERRGRAARRRGSGDLARARPARLGQRARVERRRADLAARERGARGEPRHHGLRAARPTPCCCRSSCSRWCRSRSPTGAATPRCSTLAGAALTWVIVVAVMAEGGFTGRRRYLILAAALMCVLAGIAAGWLAEELSSPGTRPRPRRHRRRPRGVRVLTGAHGLPAAAPRAPAGRPGRPSCATRSTRPAARAPSAGWGGPS